MKVLVAMSGGVDSSVAAALLRDAGHQVVGATMKLWGGASDSGCCSVSDVEDARRVAAQLGLAHHVFNFSDDFERHVVSPYVAAHAAARTPNPCIECNRHIKFDRFLHRARRLGFDAVATGHHARVERAPDGTWTLRRGADPAKDQSYVLSMLGQEQLARLLVPVGTMTKAAVRERAARSGLRTAAKPDSQDVCFITSTEGRAGFLKERLTPTPGRLVDGVSGADLGAVEAMELVTLGQRRGLGPAAGGRSGGRGVLRGGELGTGADRPARRYVTRVDLAARRVSVGSAAELTTRRLRLESVVWTGVPMGDGSPVEVQASAHGRTFPARLETARMEGGATVVFSEPIRTVAPGQTAAFYHGETVLGSGIVASNE